MTELLVTELARRFWELAGGEEPFPRGLRPAVAYALPLGVVELPRLGVATLRRYLERRGAGYPLGGDRPLRAALVARDGDGLVFLDGTDLDDERRFSLAHEVAHFLAATGGRGGGWSSGSDGPAWRCSTGGAPRPASSGSTRRWGRSS